MQMTRTFQIATREEAAQADREAEWAKTPRQRLAETEFLRAQRYPGASVSRLYRPQNFRELLSLLNSHSVEYLLVGGYAVSAHGFPRYTGNIDIFYRLGKQNTRRLAAALAEFAVPVSADELNRPNVLFRMGVKPMMLELMNEISGVTFEQAWANRIELDLGELKAPLISLADLRTNKRAAGWNKDLADLEELPEE